MIFLPLDADVSRSGEMAYRPTGNKAVTFDRPK